MPDPKRLTEEERRDMWTYVVAARPGSRHLRRLLDNFEVQAREMAEAREALRRALHYTGTVPDATLTREMMLRRLGMIAAVCQRALRRTMVKQGILHDYDLYEMFPAQETEGGEGR